MTYNSTTTLNLIRSASPCENGWLKLLKHLGKTKADDEPLSLLTVLNSNGWDDALWVLSYAMPDDRLARHFQAWCAEQVLPIFEAKRQDDNRIRGQIAMLRNDDATPEERIAARAAARDAAMAVARDAAMAAAWAAARDAARAAAMAVARDAAMAAAMAVAWAAEWDAAWAVSWAVAWHASRYTQEAQFRAMIVEQQEAAS